MIRAPTLAWVREDHPVWDDDKARVIGGAPEGAFVLPFRRAATTCRATGGAGTTATTSSATGGSTPPGAATPRS